MSTPTADKVPVFLSYHRLVEVVSYAMEGDRLQSRLAEWANALLIFDRPRKHVMDEGGNQIAGHRTLRELS